MSNHRWERRTLRCGFVAFLVALGLSAASGCQSTKAKQTASVRRAARATLAAPSIRFQSDWRFSTRIRDTGPRVPFAMIRSNGVMNKSGTGLTRSVSYSADHGRGRMVRRDSASVRYVGFGKDRTVYIDQRSLFPSLPHGKRWIKVNIPAETASLERLARAYPESTATTLVSGGFTTPQEALRFLLHGYQSERLIGRSGPVDHYAVSINLDKIVQQESRARAALDITALPLLRQASMSMEVWVRHGRIQRLLRVLTTKGRVERYRTAIMFNVEHRQIHVVAPAPRLVIRREWLHLP
jgi:hypothetical protein